MVDIIKSLKELPETINPDNIYLVKKETGIDIGVATNNVVSPEVILLKKPITIQGPTSLFHGEVGTFTITNYGTHTDYSVQSYDGVISRTDNIVTFVCNDTEKTSATIKIGTRSIVLEIKKILPVEAVIEAPVSGSSLPVTGLTLITSDFQMNYALASDTHVSTDWEIATDPEFNNIVVSSYDDAVNLTSFTP